MGPLPPIPEAVHQLQIEKRKGGEGTRVWVDDEAGLLGLVQMKVVEIHPWGAKIDDIEHPDTLVFDLDPGEGIEWDFVVETAVRLRDLLAQQGLDSWPKTTGGKGLNIEPKMAWNEAHEYTRELADRLASTAPGRYTTSAAFLHPREGARAVPAVAGSYVPVTVGGVTYQIYSESAGSGRGCAVHAHSRRNPQVRAADAIRNAADL
jgi:DNA primase